MEVRYRNIRHMLEERARESRDETYIAFYDREISFGDFHRDVCRMANAFLDLGIKKGDIVYVYQNNSPEFLVSILAANFIGAVAGPLNNWLKGEEIAYQLNDSKGRAMVIDPEFVPTLDGIRARCPHLEIVIQNQGAPP
jgi:acyl-CoA synthetase (AMP-forming)/AMP-acid ligase II